jgi:hypothetical protein
VSPVTAKARATDVVNKRVEAAQRSLRDRTL